MAKLIESSLPPLRAAMPWQDKPELSELGLPEGFDLPAWRYSDNPIIDRHAIPSANSVFNSAVVPFEDGFAGIFRCDSRSVSMDLFAGFSKDGLDWKIEPRPISFEPAPGCAAEITAREYRYDPRVVYMDGRYYVTWCNGYHGPTIGMGYTYDFKTFYQLENAFLPYNRNGVLFPRKIHGNYAMLSRPSDTGHTPFGDIFYSESPDLTYWGKHRFVFGVENSDRSAWQSKKVGPGPVPIETDEGWLLIYHGVIGTCNGFVYRMGAALLDLEEPWKVLGRSAYYILGPEKIYELAGDVPGVTFPCASLCDPKTGRIAIYYGCADTVTGVAFTTADELIGFIKRHPLS